MGNKQMHKVLVVDDEEPILELLKYNLEKNGYEVKTAQDGARAVDIAKKFIPDLVLLDIMMPVMDGYEMLKVLKEDQTLREIPVIAVTARAMKGDDARCIEAGASDYISKPVDMDQLLSLLKVWLY